MKQRVMLLIVLLFVACGPAVKTDANNTSREIKPDTDRNVAQLELEDSLKLTHIKELFYRSKAGQLFERTVADREVNGKLVSVEYFNGVVPQEIDPLTFHVLDGWFAKDKNFAYSYRPTSGGMRCIKIQGADVKTFKIFKGEIFYAIDKKHFYRESELIEGINPLKMNIKRDSDGDIVKITSGRHGYIVNESKIY